MKQSPYVGWFRHAPSLSAGAVSTSATKQNQQQQQQQQQQKKKNMFTVHKIDLDSFLDLNRWHDQLSLLLLGKRQQYPQQQHDTVFNNIDLPYLLETVVNGRLLGGSGKESEHRNNTEVDDDDGTAFNNVLSTFTSWLLYPLISMFNEEEYYNTVFFNNDDNNQTGGLKLSTGGNNNTSGSKNYTDAIDCDRGKTDSSSVCSNSTTSSTSSSYAGDPTTMDDDFAGYDDDDDDETNNNTSHVEDDSKRRIETERELKEMNVSMSEIAESYHAHKLIEQERVRRQSSSLRQRRRHRSNSIGSSSSSSQHGGGLYCTVMHPHTEMDARTNDDDPQRLDYEITQMDIARMAKNASRHLDVDSILTLPIIIYRARRPEQQQQQQQQKQTATRLPWPLSTRMAAGAVIVPAAATTCDDGTGDQSYHHICSSTKSGNGDRSDDGSSELFHPSEEDRWSFLMVNGVKSNIQQKEKEKEKNDANNTNGNTTSNNQNTTTLETASVVVPTNDNDICVICLEAFKDGDRLRVLPCDHSFHVGCIDRWLSGSYSYNECYTAGCPTCKKLPSTMTATTRVVPLSSSSNGTVVAAAADEDHNDMTGSVPSWAFVNLGSAMMAMSSSDLPECTPANESL